MTTLTDIRFETLRALLFTGSTNDMLVQWLQANGATSDCLPDAWEEMLFSKGFGDGYSRNDGWFGLLFFMGFEGQMNDRELSFWLDGGVLPVVPENVLTNLGEPLIAEGEYLVHTP